VAWSTITSATGRGSVVAAAHASGTVWNQAKVSGFGAMARPRSLDVVLLFAFEQTPSACDSEEVEQSGLGSDSLDHIVEGWRLVGSVIQILHRFPVFGA